MTAARLLIISRHPLFAEALARLAQETGCEIVGTIAEVPDALPLLRAHAPVTTIIVDRAVAETREAEWLALLQQGNAARRIILLTLEGNEMIVHERRKVTRVTEVELRQALIASTDGGTHEMGQREADAPQKYTRQKRHTEG